MATVSLQSLIDETRQAIETGAADKAVGMARHMLAHYPRLIEGWRLLGEAYLNQGQAADAAHAFEQVLAADPENVAAYYGLGLARQSLEQPEATIQAFERALEIQPNLAELRTQLLRLYAEVPGSAGQFRLSRAGLARLYARGGMYSQAVDEFRAVLDAEPERDDVKVALAEALWRDGQEDEAMDFCREILTQRPELLKPTLLLGYMLFASGDPRGEELWRRAAEQDPSLTMARTLFDILPPIRLEEPVLPEFDEAEWRAQEARRASEAAAQTSVPVAAVAAAGTATEADDLFADSWLFSTPFEAQGHVASQPAAAQPVAPADDDEALLASLLGFGENGSGAGQPQAAQERASAVPSSSAAPTRAAEQTATLDEIGLPETGDFDLEAELKPFSLDEWDEQELPTARADTQRGTMSEDLAGVQPFSLEETGAEAAGIEPFRLDDLEGEPSRAAAGESSAVDDLGEVQPFSLEDWVNEGPPPQSQPSAQAGGDEIAGVAPFSLEDWTSEDQPPRPPSETDALADVAPFSLEDLQVGTETGAPSTAGDDEMIQGLEPFSLEEFSLDVLEEESAAELSGPGAEEEQPVQERKDFRWEEPSWRRQASQPEGSAAVEGESIFARLLSRREQLGRPSSAATTPPDVDNDLFFSMDDEPLRPDWETPAQSEATATSHEGQAADLSFEEALTLETTADAPEGASAGSQEAVREVAPPFSLAELGLEDETLATDSAVQPTGEGEVEPFSLAELGLEEESGATDTAAEATTEGEVEPFSLAELGLEDETLATDSAVQPTGEGEVEPFSLAELGLEEESGATDTAAEATTEGEVEPFSLAELGLEDETLATDSAVQPTGEGEVEPFSLAELGLSDEELQLLEPSPAAPSEPGAYADASTEDESATFSLADLGLSDEDLAALGLEPTPSSPTDAQPGAPSDAQPPFSLADIDLPEEQATEEPSVAERGQVSTAVDNVVGSTMPSATPPRLQAETPSDSSAAPAELADATDVAGAEALPSGWPTTEAPASADVRSEEPVAAEVTAQRETPTPAALPPALVAVLSQLHAAPDNDALRLAAARMSQALQATDQALEQYRLLIRRERLLDDVVQDLQDMIAECSDPAVQRRLHRLLGDAYTKQNRIAEAMEAYSWTPARAN